MRTLEEVFIPEKWSPLLSTSITPKGGPVPGCRREKGGSAKELQPKLSMGLQE